MLSLVRAACLAMCRDVRRNYTSVSASWLDEFNARVRWMLTEEIERSSRVGKRFAGMSK